MARSGEVGEMRRSIGYTYSGTTQSTQAHPHRHPDDSSRLFTDGLVPNDYMCAMRSQIVQHSRILLSYSHRPTLCLRCGDPGKKGFLIRRVRQNFEGNIAADSH